MSSAQTSEDERFVLQEQRGHTTRHTIYRERRDPDLGIWIRCDRIASFASREDARIFMIAWREATANAS